MLGRRPLALHAAGSLQPEAGPARSSRWAPAKAALVASWSPTSRQSRSLSTLLLELERGGYESVVISTSPAPKPLQWPYGLPRSTTVLRRPNVGYDFGSWAAGLSAMPGIARAEHALLVNDSLVGPFASLTPILARFEESDVDVWGLVDTTQDAYHFQSHFVGYRDASLARPELASFWRGIRVQPTKRELILRYEIGYMRTLERAGLSRGVGFPWGDCVVFGGNPTSAGWRRLLHLGFPWIKREIVLRPPPEVPDVADVPRVVQSMFGEDVTAWT